MRGVTILLYSNVKTRRLSTSAAGGREFCLSKVYLFYADTSFEAHFDAAVVDDDLLDQRLAVTSPRMTGS